MAGRIKILIVTDSPVLPSGMAETTRLIFGSLLDLYPDQYELHQIGLFHCYAVTAARWPIYPTLAGKGPNGKVRFDPDDKYGQKTFPKCVAKIRPDIVFGFGETQRVLNLCTLPECRQHRLVLYVNFDGLPVPASFCSHLAYADLIFTKSQFAADVLARAVPGIQTQKLGYMYSPADTERFVPISDAARLALRADLFPAWMPRNGFVLGWVGRNQWRKQIWVLYKVIHYLRTGAYLVCGQCGRVTLFDWDPARQCHLNEIRGVLESPPGFGYETCLHCRSPEVTQAEPMSDAFLWLHMADEPEADWPAERLEGQFGLKRGRDIHYTEGHKIKAALGPADMPALYNLWDCLLFLSGGEGFGLPAWEAMCCSLPIVYTNYSSHAEFITRAKGGLPVSGVLQPEKNTCIWRMLADLPQAIQAIRRLYFDRDLRGELGRNARAYVENFAPRIQAEHWHKVFQQVMAGNQSVASAANCPSSGR